MRNDSAPRWQGYLAGTLSILVATAILKLLGVHINSTTVALGFLLVVLFIATRWGSLAALFTSLLAMFCFNFFFLPPFGTLSISAPDNWVALVAFLITAITAGQMSARVKHRAEEAEAGSREIERLYAELREAFDLASHAEALRQSEKLKSALLDAVTHDLRTPLASIKASITTLLDEVKAQPGDRPIDLDTESKIEMMEVINEESDRLNRFIGGLIEMARIEAGELHLRRSWGAVEEIISTAMTRAEPLTKGREIKVEIEAELPVVRVDERAVSEVIYTLLDNAVKYSPNSTSIGITAKRSDDGMIEISITDHGIGIPEDLRERVFDKFFRATRDGDIHYQPSGTGMGLAIAKGIIEAHDGRIWIESVADQKGIQVRFTVPIGDDDVFEATDGKG